ncbi:MAG: efflux RND transporter permease subunit [Lachnospiraceae bacterium]|nr:efflux RND transporter permease subunit [Lachnospiraceae bacterium]
MKHLTKITLNRPVAVIVILVGLILFSIVSITGMPLKLMPDINFPVMVVYATYPGASPEEVDENVMEKILDACSNVSGLKKTQTVSYENYGTLIMQFNYGTDISKAHDDIRSRLEGIANELPEKVDDPTILEVETDAIDDMTLSVSTDSKDLDLLNLINKKLEPQLRRAAALADISITGGDEKYISIQLIPEYASQYGISPSSVVAAITAVNYSIPAGSVSYGDQTLNMETEVRYDDIEKLKQVPITTQRGEVIHLYDVCNINYGISDKTSLSRYNGGEDISVGLKKRQSSTSVTLSRQIKSILDDFSKSYPEINIRIIYDSADEILAMLKSVFKTLIIGIAVAMAVIFLFFGDIKGSLIVGSTMPVSLLVALVCMYFAGISLNVISMNALVISIGMITDNAVVVIELCFKKHADGLDYKDSAYEGTSVVIKSVVASTITTVVVYLPLALLKGLSGQFFKQLGFTIVFVLLASLISATTIVPLFFSLYKPKERKNNPMSVVLEKLSVVYSRFLGWILNKSVLVVIISVVLLLVSVFLATGLRTELIAATDEGIAQMSLTFRPGLSLEKIDETVVSLEQFVKDSGLCDDYSISISESSSSATVVAYKSDEVDMTTAELVDMWNKSLQDYSSVCDITVSAGSSTGMSSFNMGGAEEFDIAADDLPSLRAASNMIKDVIESASGVISVSSSVDGGGAGIKISVNPEMAQANGFSASMVSQMVYLNMTGTSAGEVTIDNNTYEIKVEYPKDYYRSLDDVRTMTFMNSRGVNVPLSEMADIHLSQAAQSVTRTDGRFSAAITAVMTSETKDEIMDIVRPQLDELELPEGANFINNAVEDTMNEEFTAVGQAIIIALYLVFMVMAIQFESIRYSILIMFCIPFASIGSINMMRLMDVKISLSVLLGVLMLAGIVVNNGIIFIDTANQFIAQGEEMKKALVHAGKDRMRPILITTLTTELSMIPVAFKFSKNAEALQGMGVVIVGGLFASTLLTLLLLPNFYLMLGKRKKKKKEKVKEKVKEND